MTKFETTNSFAALSVDFFDSDDSGYAEDEIDPPASNPAPPETPICTPSERGLVSRIDSEDRELVSRKDRQNVKAEDTLPLARKPGHGRSQYNKPTTPGNWHESSPKETLKRRRETDDLPYSAQPDRRSDRNIDRLTQRTKGAIVRHKDLHHFEKGSAPRNRGKIMVASNGVEYLEKPRMFLVVDRAGERIMECPIYTYGGKGLRDRAKMDWPEYCSIRPLYVRANDFVNQSPEKEVLEAVRVDWDKELKDTMVVRLCDVRSREYDPSVEIIGRVSRKAHRYAAKRLLELVGKAVTPERH
jgi:hypothetical protein